MIFKVIKTVKYIFCRFYSCTYEKIPTIIVEIVETNVNKVSFYSRVFFLFSLLTDEKKKNTKKNEKLKSVNNIFGTNR